MSREEIYNAVTGIIQEVCDIPENTISPESSIIEDLDISSLEVVTVISKLSKKFNLSINAKDLMAVETVDNLVDLIEAFSEA